MPGVTPNRDRAGYSLSRSVYTYTEWNKAHVTYETIGLLGYIK